MFGGYFCHRRRLQTLFIAIILSLIFVKILSHQENIASIHRFYLTGTNALKSKLRWSSLLEIRLPFKKLTANILSSIEFINSPYFQSESYSSNIIPIIVLSKASHIEIRDAIRRTWAFDSFYRNHTVEMKVFFLIGIDDYTIKRNRAEQMIFNDVILVSIPDTDLFIAYKEISAMMWMRSYLPNALFYIKTDEDVIINTEAMVTKLLPMIENNRNEDLVIGWFGSEHTLSRGTRSQKFSNAVKGSVDMDFDYAMSLLYIITSKASDRMLDVLSHVKQITQAGDSFVTGVLRDAARIQSKNLANDVADYRYELSNGACADEFKKNTQLLLCSSIALPSVKRSISEYFEAWNILLSQN